MKKNNYKAILFDLDGVLVNMPDGHYEALNRALSLFGTSIEREEHYRLFNGLPTRKKIEALEKQGRLPTGLREFINEVKQKHTKEIIPKYCPPDYSKIILLKQLQGKNLKLACCSNSIKETLHLMLKSSQLFEYFDFIIGNDEVVAAHVGINSAACKLALFVISGIFAAMVGAVMAPRYTYIEPSIAFTAELSFQVVIMALLGGVHRLWGPLVGVIPFTILWEVIAARFPGQTVLLLGIAFLLIVYLIPNGVVGRIESALRAAQRRVSHA